MIIANAEYGTWCVDTKRNWPHERLNCELILGIESFSPRTREPIILECDNSKPLSVELYNMLSEWHFKQISIWQIVNEANNTSRYNKQAIAQSMSGDISFDFIIERNGAFYRNVYTMPILGSYAVRYGANQVFQNMAVVFLCSLWDVAGFVFLAARLSTRWSNIGGVPRHLHGCDVRHEACTHHLYT